jgi:hypothetical protein
VLKGKKGIDEKSIFFYYDKNTRFVITEIGYGTNAASDVKGKGK